MEQTSHSEGDSSLAGPNRHLAQEQTSPSSASGGPPRGRSRGRGRGSGRGRAASSGNVPKPPSAVAAAADDMEQTSASEVSQGPPLGRGRGLGRASGHGRAASSSNAPKPKSRGTSSSHAPKTMKTIRKARGRMRKAGPVSWLQQPSSNPKGDMEDTSASEETLRIAAAARKMRSWDGDADECTSSEEAFTTPVASDSQGTPNTSGAFDYATWLVARLTGEQRLKLTRAFTWIDLCSGLGTPLLIYEALRRALQSYDLSPAGECTGMTEICKERRAALRRRAMHVSAGNPSIFSSNASLTTPRPKDDQGNIQDIPVADILFFGIVCVDISACSSTPKSLTDSSGATGKSWLDFLKYLENLDLEQRPMALVLECVDNLSHNRSVQGRVEKGTLLVIEALRELGYVGQWRKVSATHFFLPQRRPRVWALFLKVVKGVGPKAMKERERDVAKAFEFIMSSQTSSHESLKQILDRTPTPYGHRPGKPARGRQAWLTTQGPKFQHRHGLSDEEVGNGQDEFLQATADVLLPRQQAAVWLELCRLRRKGQVPNWKEGVLVSDCGSSVGWLSVARDMFPCIRPGNSYLVLEQGEAKLAQGPLCLALQGIGPDEANALELLIEEDGFLRQLAGNAFCANICLVFLVAALLSR